MVEDDCAGVELMYLCERVMRWSLVSIVGF
jgi:hypothetical protein